MASNQHLVTVKIDDADLLAYAHELIEILKRYGVDEQDCQPHLRTERAKAMERARQTFRQCIEVGDG